jgi:hypothetical protein
MVKKTNLTEKALEKFTEVVENAKNLVNFSEKDGKILGERAEILKVGRKNWLKTFTIP